MKALNENKWFPKVDTVERAKLTSKQGYVCAYVVAAFTMFFTADSIASGNGGWALLDAAIFLVLGIFIQHKFSRVAAILALIMFIVEKTIMFEVSNFSVFGIIIAACIIVGLVNGVRGTLALHRLKKKTETK